MSKFSQFTPKNATTNFSGICNLHSPTQSGVEATPFFTDSYKLFAAPPAAQFFPARSFLIAVPWVTERHVLTGAP